MPSLAAAQRAFDRQPFDNAVGPGEQDWCLCRRLAGKDDIEMRRKMIDSGFVPDHVTNTNKRLHHKQTRAHTATICH